MTFESLLEKVVGPLGRWQLLLFVLIITVSDIPLSMIPQLANLSPDFVCSDPFYQGWSFADIANASDQVLQLQPQTDTRPDFRCQRYDLTALNASRFNNSTKEEKLRNILMFAAHTNLSLQSCPGPWLYDENSALYRHSLVQDFDLVCDRQSMIPLNSVTFMIGFGIGMTLGGQITDRFGRRAGACFGFSLKSALGFLMSLCPTPLSYFFSNTFIGIFSGIGYTAVYVFFLEMTNHRHRNTLNVLDGAFYYVVGQNVIVLASYVLQNWRLMYVFHGGITAVCCIFLFLYFPESPRWLVAQNRSSEAVEILRKAALVNGRTKAVAAAITEEDIQLTTSTIAADPNQSHGFGCQTWLAFFGSPALAKRWVPLSWMWIAIAASFFGVSYYSVRLRGNPYLIALAMSFSALPVKVLHWILLEKTNRKGPLLGCLFCAALSTALGFLALMFDWSATVVIVASTLAIAALTMVFDILYLITPELFPTLFRSKALGVSAGLSRIGAITGLFTERLPKTWPLLIYTCVLLLAFVCCLFLPPGSYKTMFEAEGESQEITREKEHDIEGMSEAVPLSQPHEDDML